jgi:hypothetical protein
VSREEVDERMHAMFVWYLEHQDELVAKYNGRVIAIIGEEVVNSYDNYEDAITDMTKHFTPGTFMVQYVSPGDSAYTVYM